MALTRPRRQSTEPLAPALTFYFMTGEHTVAPRRLPGWFALIVELSEADIKALWILHKRELLAEARAAAFKPFGVLAFDRADPSLPAANDPARDRWAEAFSRVHGY
jgi:hypothetical protein